MSTIPRGQTPEMKAYQKAYRAANPRDRRAYAAAYRAANKEKLAAYREANKERKSARSKEHYAANRERLIAQVKARYESDPAKVQAYQAKYYEANAEKVKARVAAYKEAYPEKKTTIESRRRARKKGNGGSHTAQEREEKFALLGNVCFYCGSAGPLTIDHDLPLSLGGTDYIVNILPACQSCNSRKSARTAAEFVSALRGE